MFNYKGYKNNKGNGNYIVVATKWWQLGSGS